MKSLIALFIFSTLIGCSSIEIVDTGYETLERKEFSPTNPDNVRIYRSMTPQISYIEIGIVTVKGISKLNEIYSNIRNESATKGADAVIEFNLESEEVSTTSMVTSCNANGACSTHAHTSTSIQHTASGTLIKINGDKK